MSRTNKLIAAMLLVVVIALAFGGGFFIGQANPPATSSSSPSATSSPPGPDVIKQAWDYINEYYVDPSKINSANMTGSAIAAMIASLNDRYDVYISPQEYNIVQSDFAGQFDGIGATVSQLNGQIVVVKPIAGAPAEAAGIKANDVILAVNGESTANMSLDVAVSKIRGPSGTTVTLTILHQGETTPVDITVTRAQIQVPTVQFEMRGDIALITILQFTSLTNDELDKIMPKLAENNAKGIILDLRGNPGGLLDDVVDVASHFITSGTIVSVRSRQGTIETLKATHQSVTTSLPMVVLVDKFSASGSEVLTGALQDYKRATVAGTVTYGKGSVNTLLKLSDGSGIYLTISRWLTPNGRLIEGNGITPDVPLTTTGEDEIQWALDHLQGVK